MNQITEKLTTATPAVNLDIAHEQTVNALQDLYDLADSLSKQSNEAQFIAKEIVTIAENISLGCKNIFTASNSVKNETLDVANKIVNGWQQIATSTVNSLNVLSDKFSTENKNN